MYITVVPRGTVCKLLERVQVAIVDVDTRHCVFQRGWNASGDGVRIFQESCPNDRVDPSRQVECSCCRLPDNHSEP